MIGSLKISVFELSLWSLKTLKLWTKSRTNSGFFSLKCLFSRIILDNLYREFKQNIYKYQKKQIRAAQYEVSKISFTGLPALSGSEIASSLSQILRFPHIVDHLLSVSLKLQINTVQIMVLEIRQFRVKTEVCF